MKITPAPFTTKFTEKYDITIPWRLWLQGISKNMVDSVQTISASNFSYSLNGNILTFILDSDITASYTIPHKSSTKQMLMFYDKSLSSFNKIIVEKDQTNITLPACICNHHILVSF